MQSHPSNGIRSLSALACAALLTLSIQPIVAHAAGGSTSTPSPTVSQTDPREMAKDSYNRALRYRDKAWEYEAKASSEGQDAEKYAKKAEKEYGKARKALESAIKNDPMLYQAHSSLGYVLRKTGEYQNSLAAYNRALEINPRYAEAIEYRGEAFLGLNRIEDAKTAYMELFRTDRKRADELMDAMQEWVDARSTDAGDVDAGLIAEFSGWVEERAGLAAQAGDSSGGSW